MNRERPEWLSEAGLGMDRSPARTRPQRVGAPCLCTAESLAARGGSGSWGFVGPAGAPGTVKEASPAPFDQRNPAPVVV
ncbi:hypothetical protein NDU88_010180 [Pleurodeles waltl]|uniref:Uncharacterized protein n=1 Tax=Pleurodeles waltl TaxID=8319 RepID=A0AAV7Q172_PLEWA|nr:hypothetical protein NDU88_010180 [Pleurodeles waltl]